MKKGFTLLELIIVVIIIGILVAIALPQFTRVTERARLTDGKTILGAIRAAQLRFKQESPTGAYDTSATCANLDVSLTASTNFPAGPVCTDATSTSLAYVVRLNGYRLNIASSGIISCTDVGTTFLCADAGCVSGGTCP